MTKLCIICGEEIPEKRLEILPKTTTCVGCSCESKRKIGDLDGKHVVQHTGGLHEKYLNETEIDKHPIRRMENE